MKQWVEPAEAVVEDVVEVLHGRRRQPPRIHTGVANTNNSTTSNEKGKTEERVEDLDSESKNSKNQKFISEIMDGEEEEAEIPQDEKSQTHSIMPSNKGEEEEEEEEDKDLKSKLKLIEEMLGEDEEMVEMEFESAVKHIDTHTTLYCPNCSSCIAKVLLRKKKVFQPKTTPTPEILGCFSCFSFFIPSGDGFRLAL